MLVGQGLFWCVGTFWSLFAVRHIRLDSHLTSLTWQSRQCRCILLDLPRTPEYFRFRVRSQFGGKLASCLHGLAHSSTTSVDPVGFGPVFRWRRGEACANCVTAKPALHITPYGPQTGVLFQLYHSSYGFFHPYAVLEQQPCSEQCCCTLPTHPTIIYQLSE